MSSNKYMSAYMRRRYQKRYEEAIQRLGGKCVSCGNSKDLQFDHIIPATKSFTIGKKLAGIAKERLEAELNKCQLLCTKCHEGKSIKEKGYKPAKDTHGTVSAYKYCGPIKCDSCKAAKAKWTQEYRKRVGRS